MLQDDKAEKGGNVTDTSGLTPDASSEEKEKLLAADRADVADKAGEADGEKDEEEEEADLRPKFASPIWIDEIQKNKIFNRQKSLLSEESFKDLAANGHHQVAILLTFVNPFS